MWNFVVVKMSLLVFIPDQTKLILLENIEINFGGMSCCTAIIRQLESLLFMYPICQHSLNKLAFLD